MRLRRLFWSPTRRRAEAELRERVARLLTDQAEHDRQRRVTTIHRALF